METVTLSNGLGMPCMHFGVYQIPDLIQCEDVVSEALRLGWRGIDTATAYLNERAVGRAIEKSGIARSDVFITTKLFIYEMSEQGAERAIRRSLDLLGVESIDLYLIHQPFGDVYGAWRTIERYYAAGILKAIGVSNFAPDRLMDFALHQRIRPMVNQIEVNPYYQQKEALPVNRDLGIVPQAWAPFAEGRNHLFTNPTLQSIADKHHASVAQVILAWLRMQNIVTVSKSVTPSRMAENLAAASLVLDRSDMNAIRALDTGKSQFFSHQDPKMVQWLCQLPQPTQF